MKKAFSAGFGHAYKRAIKPVLFRRSPDDVHESMIKTGSRLMQLPLANLAPKAVAYHNHAALSQKLLGVDFPNPVGLSAGLDKNAEIIPLVKAIGFGFATAGSITAEVCPGNPRPWFHRLPAHRSLVVYAGLANQGAERISRRIAGYDPGLFRDFPLIVSVAKTNSPETCSDDEAIADYTASVERLSHETRVRVFEINISCPNTYGGEPFTTPERLGRLLSALDDIKHDKPVWIKMPINLPWPEFDALLQVIVKHNVAAVTIGNLNKDRSAISPADLPHSVKGNLSGKPTQALSDDLIAKTYAAYGDTLMIIGVGGIFSAADAYRKICLGASLVELITGMIFEGPQLIGQINRELVDLLRADGFTNISQAIGSKNK